MGKRAFIFVVDGDEPDDDGGADTTSPRRAALFDVSLDSDLGQLVWQALHAQVAYHDEETVKRVRAWAVRQELLISDRGPIPEEIWRQYVDHLLTEGLDTVAGPAAAGDVSDNKVVQFKGRERPVQQSRDGK